MLSPNQVVAVKKAIEMTYDCTCNVFQKTKYIKENNYIFKAIIPKMNTMKELNETPLKLENPKIKKHFNTSS